MNDKLGIAVLGCGYWGINYVRIFNELPNTRVVAVCEKRVDRLQEVGKRFPDAILTTEVDDALGQEGVDAVVVCTEATSHYEVVSKCISRGKHVLVEKPITTISDHAQKLIDQAAAKKVTLMVGHTFLYNPAVRKVKEYVETGEVGRVYYLYASRTNLGPIRHDVNALWDLAPHDISIFNYLLDSKPDWVSAVGTKVLRNAREDVGFVTLGYPNGIVGHIHVSWADPNKVREVVVVGSDRRVVFNDLNPLEQVRVFEKGVFAPSDTEAETYGEHQFLIRDGSIISPRIEVSEPLKNQCNHFLETVTLGIRPLTDGEAGMAVVQVMEAIDRSIARNGEPVKLPQATGTEVRVPSYATSSNGHQNGHQLVTRK